MSKQGPSFIAKCTGCAHVLAERYRVQGDSGTDVSCIHPDIGRRDVGDTVWATPDWCPLLLEAAERFLVDIRERLGKGGS